MWSPPPKLTLSEWADTYAWLSPESSAQQLSKWKTLPYQKGIMDAMVDPDVERVTWMKSARIGYTKTLNNLIGYIIQNDPSNILVVQPTIEDAQGYSKDEIMPMFRDTPILSELVPNSKTRDTDQTILRKHFPGMTLYIVGANSPRGFRRISARFVLFDEVDGYPPTAGNEGDQIALGERRAEYYWNKKIIIGSTPTIKGLSRVERSYLQSDMRQYHVPCPHCGFMQVLEWSNIDFSVKGTIRKPVYICDDCEKVIEYNKHRWMMERGKWVAQKEFDGHAGFQIWAAYSYSPGATWARIVKAFIDSKDDPEMLKTWVNTWRGQTWEEEGESASTSDIFDAREDYGPDIPIQAGIITAAVDVQDDRLEFVAKAWGEGEQSWNIEHIVIAGDPGKIDVWDKLDLLSQKTYHHQNGLNLHISIMVIDRGGHHADRVDQFVRTRLGRNIFAIQGRAQGEKPIVGRPKRSNKGKIPLFTINTDAAKNLVVSRLKSRDVMGIIHLNKNFTFEFCQQLTAEKRRLKYHHGQPYYTWEKSKSERNEAFDLEVYNLASLRILFPDMFMFNKYISEFLTKNNVNVNIPLRQRRVLSKGINH
jgi:phage terminase large subunit GpA-like protein